MSWEIQGAVSDAASIDGLVAAPTEAPTEAEAPQVAAVADALKALLQADVVKPAYGVLYVRAGGHANPGGGPVEGEANEMVTLTIDYQTVEIAEAADPNEAGAVEAADAVDVASTVEAPAEGTEPEPHPEG